MTKTILALALASLVASPVSAEVWTLHNGGHWSVYYSSDEDGDQCRAEVGDRDGLYFAITYDRYGLDGNVTVPGANFTGGEAIDLWVDRRDYWTSAVDFRVDFIWFDITNPDFLEQLSIGTILNMDLDRDGVADYWFSLDGSAGALGAFAACFDNMNSPLRQVGAPA